MSSQVIKAKNVQLVAKGTQNQSHFSGRLEGGGQTNNFSSGSASAPRNHTIQDNGDEKTDRNGKHTYDQGFAAGAASQKEQSLTALQALSEALREMGNIKRQLYADAEEQMMSLVLAVAEKVIYNEVSTNSEIILGVLREAVKGVVDPEAMKIHLNPQDLLFITDMKPDFLKEFHGLKNVTLEEDKGLQRGGALLETIAGEVDARLEQRVKEVKGALKIK